MTEARTWALAGFFPGVGKLGVWALREQKSPSGVQGWIYGGGFMAKPQKPSRRLVVKIMYK